MPLTDKRRTDILNELASLENDIYPYIEIVKTYNWLEANGGVDHIPGVSGAEFKRNYEIAMQMALNIRLVMAEMAQEVYTPEEHQKESQDLVERLDTRMKAKFDAWKEANPDG